MNRRSMILIALLVFAMVVAPAAYRPAKAQGQTLTIWADLNRAPILEAVAPEFTDEYGVEVVIQQLAFGDIRDQFIIAGPAGEGPDIFIGAHDWIGELVASGLLSPIDLGANAESFLPAAIDAFTYEGELYGMPYSAESVGFFRNPELVPDAPETWDDVRAISEELVGAGTAPYGYVIQENDPFHLFPLMTAFGGYVFGFEEGVGYDPQDVGIDSEGAIAALEWLDGMVEDGLTPDGLDYDSMHALFESGEAAMMVSGPWAVERIKASGVPFEISEIPAGPAGPARPFLSVQGFMVSAFSQDPQLAQIFLNEFVATDDVMLALYEGEPRPPAWMPILEEIEDPLLAAFGESAVNGIPMPAIPEMSAVWTAWGNAMQLVIQQQLEPADALADAAEQIRAAIAGEETEGSS
ncbi:MAG: maltose ABC transporter substrate-binding protein [Chloroflexota bacterium]|nr:maltose ABC transporter substrate-binding protein [Anaerolineae bacterium]HMM28474.1 maltose ABC transporter substrate-binding protein [Aggregatilineaceae bacterium]